MKTVTVKLEDHHHILTIGVSIRTSSMICTLFLAQSRRCLICVLSINQQSMEPDAVFPFEGPVDDIVGLTKLYQG